MDFCVYDVIMPVLKSGMIIKMQNKLHDRLFSGLMRQLTKEESEQKGGMVITLGLVVRGNISDDERDIFSQVNLI